MASFPIKMSIFPTPPPFNPKFENVPLELYHRNFATAESPNQANNSCKKISAMSYHLAAIHQ